MSTLGSCEQSATSSDHHLLKFTLDFISFARLNAVGLMIYVVLNMEILTDLYFFLTLFPNLLLTTFLNVLLLTGTC